MRYLLDTNMIIAVIQRADRIVMRRLSIHRAETAISSIVSHELYYGAFNSSRLTANLAEIDGLGLESVPFDGNDAREAGRIRARLRQGGIPIGPYDLLIAGQALARNLIVVTANVREFERVDGLAIENWIAD